MSAQAHSGWIVINGGVRSAGRGPADPMGWQREQRQVVCIAAGREKRCNPGARPENLAAADPGCTF